MKQILVPTDFSEGSENATEYAVQLAKDLACKILLFHTYHLPTPVTEVPVMVITPGELQKENEELLKKRADKLMTMHGVEVNYRATIDSAVEGIIAESKNADLIVMGIYGAGKLTRALMGSTAVSVTKNATIPVLLIPEHVAYKRPERIAFACDYDPESDPNTLDTLKEMSEIFNSELLIVNVKDKNETVTIEEKKAACRIDQKLSDTRHYYYYLENKDFLQGLEEFLLLQKPDMIAVIPHRYNLFERITHLSISKKMAFQTTVPFLTLPETGK